ncbi:IS3 family transposase, partial [Burkholderia dolosa]|nr:IS3 family transposase [Burkholderia dolosa]
GFAALLPRPKGRHPKMSTSPLPEPAPPESEPDTRTREQLLKEVEYLRAEVAYLKKLDALIRAEQRQTRRAKRK